MLPLLGVGKDIEIFEREEAMWKKHGITLIRAYSMLEAIEKLVKTDFIFIAISSDRINYLPQLRIMRDLTYVPIIVVTSKFSAEDEVVALQSGADNYTLWRGTTQENVQSALAFIHIPNASRSTRKI